MHFWNRCAHWKFVNGAENICFAGAEISLDVYLSQILRRDRNKSL
jgi:hypothetical protein